MDNTRDQNEFNMAVSYLNRLNSILYSADNAALELDAHGWYHSLHTLFRELSTEMTNEEIKEWKAKAEALNDKVISQAKTNQRLQVMSISKELYSSLSDFELFLRKILKESGLQGKMKQDPRKAIS